MVVNRFLGHGDEACMNEISTFIKKASEIYIGVCITYNGIRKLALKSAKILSLNLQP